MKNGFNNDGFCKDTHKLTDSENEDDADTNKNRQFVAGVNDKKRESEAFENFNNSSSTTEKIRNDVETENTNETNEILNEPDTSKTEENTFKKRRKSEKSLSFKIKSPKQIGNAKVHYVNENVAMFDLNGNESDDDSKKDNNLKNNKSDANKTTPKSSKKSNEILFIELNAKKPELIEKETRLEPNSKLSIYAIFCLAIAVFGSSFQVGWYIGIYNVPVRTIQRFFNQTFIDRYGVPMNENTWTLLWSILNALYPAGGAIGGLAGGFIADYFGRKKALLLTNVFTFTSGILAVIAKPIKSYESLIVGRFFAGVQSGLFSGIIGLYLSEIPPKEIRGRVGCLNHFTLSVGILSANVLGLDETLGTDTSWPFLVGITFIPMIVHLVFLPLCTETPKYLFSNPDKARKALGKLRKVGSSIEKEMCEIQSEIDAQTKEFKYSDFIKDKYLQRALITTLGKS
jgi:hypothetical protein